MLSNNAIQNLAIHGIEGFNFDFDLFFFDVFTSLGAHLCNEGLAEIWSGCKELLERFLKCLFPEESDV